MNDDKIDDKTKQSVWKSKKKRVKSPPNDNANNSMSNPIGEKINEIKETISKAVFSESGPTEGIMEGMETNVDECTASKNAKNNRTYYEKISQIIDNIAGAPDYVINIIAREIINICSIPQPYNDNSKKQNDISVVASVIKQFLLTLIIFIVTINWYLLIFFQDYTNPNYEEHKNQKSLIINMVDGRIEHPLPGMFDSLPSLFRILFKYSSSVASTFNVTVIDRGRKLAYMITKNPMMLFAMTFFIVYTLSFSIGSFIINSTISYLKGNSNEISGMLMVYIILRLIMDVIEEYMPVNVKFGDTDSMLNAGKTILMPISMVRLAFTAANFLFQLIWNIVKLQFTSFVFILNLMFNCFMPVPFAKFGLTQEIGSISKILESIIIGSRYYGWNPFETAPNSETGKDEPTKMSYLYWGCEKTLLFFVEIVLILFLMYSVIVYSRKIQNMDVLIGLVIITLMMIGFIIGSTQDVIPDVNPVVVSINPVVGVPIVEPQEPVRQEKPDIASQTGGADDDDDDAKNKKVPFQISVFKRLLSADSQAMINSETIPSYIEGNIKGRGLVGYALYSAAAMFKNIMKSININDLQNNPTAQKIFAKLGIDPNNIPEELKYQIKTDADNAASMAAHSAQTKERMQKMGSAAVTSVTSAATDAGKSAMYAAANPVQTMKGIGQSVVNLPVNMANSAMNAASRTIINMADAPSRISNGKSLIPNLLDS